MTGIRTVARSLALAHVRNNRQQISKGALLVVLLLFLPARVFGQEVYLYSPQSVPAQTHYPAHSIVVNKIRIKTGETLSLLSKRYMGKGSYYPQILLFNAISNPHRIYAGASLLVPVRAASFTADHNGQGLESRRIPASPEIAASPDKTPKNTPSVMVSAEQLLFDQSVSLFSQGRFQKAADSFSHFLETYPASPLAADAILYRAESYYELSKN